MDLKVVETYDKDWEAGMAKSILEAEGIPAFVDGGLWRTVGVPFKPLRLLVADVDLAKAQEVLRRWRESAEPLPAEEDEAGADAEEPTEEMDADGADDCDPADEK